MFADIQTMSEAPPSSAKAKPLRAFSIDEGIQAMDDANVLFAYLPLVMTPELQRLKETIEKNDLSFQFQVTAPQAGIQDLYSRFEAAGVDRNSLPFSFSDAADFDTGSLPKVINVQPGLPLYTSDRETPFHFSDIDRYEWGVGRLMIQANEQKFTLQGEHKDDDTTVTVNAYLSGKGMAYKVNGHYHRIKPPIITIHRGEDHPLALKDPALAVDHKGFEHPPYNPETGEGRANILMTFANKDILKGPIHRDLQAALSH